MRRTAVHIASALLLTGCASTGQAEGTPTDGPELPETVASAPEEVVEPTEPAEPTGPERNERGNIEKSVGEEGGLTDETTGETVLTFAVDKITPDFQCTGEFAEGPERGHFVAIDLRMATAPAPTFDAEQYFTVSSYDFKFIGSDGITVDELGSFATYSCLADGQEFTQDALAPSQKYAGTIVIDVPESSGTLLYLPSATGGLSGWEWTF